MKKRFALFFVFICLVSFANADKVSIVLKQADSSEINNTWVEIQAYGQESFTTTKYIADAELIQIDLEKGSWKIEIFGDDLSTAGKDYYTTYQMSVTGDIYQTVHLLPVGTLRGKVVDKLDNVVDNAVLDIECSSNYGRSLPNSTDEFGSFSINYLGVGDCTIKAMKKNSVGFKTVSVKQGEISDITIELDQSLAERKVSVVPFLIVGVIAIGASFFFFKKRKKGLPKKSEEIIETLDEREKHIVDFLISAGGNSTQAKIYHETGIPKTSLHRYLKKLERKNIIKIKDGGNVNKVSFTEWFCPGSPK